MDSTLSIEQTLSHERFERRQERAIRNGGFGASEGAQAIARRALPTLVEGLAAELNATARANSTDAATVRILKAMDAEVVSLCLLQTMLHAVAADAGVLKVSIAIGKAVNGEMWAQELRAHDAKLAERIDRSVRRRHASVDYRKTAARAIARRAGFQWHGRWTREQCAQLGSWLMNVGLKHLPDLFALVEEDRQQYLTVTEGGLEIARAACRQAVQRSPVFLPSALPPVTWTDWNKGGPADPRMQRSATLLRSHHHETAAAVRAAISSGRMRPALDALNTIQATAWRINNHVLAVMQECVERGLKVPGLPQSVDFEMPAKPRLWDDMSDLERTLWRIQASKVKKANRALIGERIGFEEDFETAKQLAELPRFYTPCNMDWRGRVYALPHFNFQREDRVRGLFLFADGEPIGNEGIQWLKVHTANCGDFGKVSKKSYEDRLEWADRNVDLIKALATDPLNRLVWTEADKPWLFLAACIELTNALDEGPSYVSSLPVSWDGSCSGLQHLCAMTRAAEGAYVNLTETETPQDVYQRVAEAAAVSIAEDLSDEKLGVHARRCMDYGVTRAVVKRNVMTFAYSSKKFGMAQQQVEDLMEPLSLKVMAGELDEHPFGEDEGRATSKYLAAKVYHSIEHIVEKPAQAMAFLQRLAKTMAHEGKALRWITPTGLPWCNRYHEPDTKQVRLWLHDKGVRVAYRALVTVGDKKSIAKERSVNGVAPNFVHALDAAHLALTVNAGVAEGMAAFALVHDSFGCHASRAARFHGIIREQFVEMYERHDVLSEVLQQAQCDLGEHNQHRWPDVLSQGLFNIRNVLHAKYAFS